MFYKAKFNETNNEEIIIEKEELTEEKLEQICKKKADLDEDEDLQYQFKSAENEDYYCLEE